jgi:undecaprenyl-diphosphatase
VPIYQAIVLGIVQGFTEFAPVSSSGHLILVPWLFDWPILRDPDLNKAFDVALHIGTFVGAVIYFRKDLAALIGAWVRSVRRRRVEGATERIAWYLVIGSIPGAIAGAAFQSTIEDVLGAPWIIAVGLAVGGILLYVVDRIRPQGRGVRDLTWRSAVGIGLAQAAALQPGVSRSGITITAGRLIRMNREAAARFSFLLSLPIIGGAALYKTAELIKNGGIPADLRAAFFWGMLSAAVSGFLVIKWLLAYLKTRDFLPFMIYRLVVAAGIVLVITTGFRTATV